MTKVDIRETDSPMLGEVLENPVKCFVWFCWTVKSFWYLTAVQGIGQAAFYNARMQWYRGFYPRLGLYSGS